jgi:virginiamycin B lyase
VLPFGATSNPTHIILGPDGNLWFTEQTAGRVARVVPSAFSAGTLGGITEWAVNPGHASPGAITAGPDGAMWFGETANSVGRLTIAGLITDYSTTHGPNGIVTGPDRALWWTENGPNSIGRFS